MLRGTQRNAVPRAAVQALNRDVVTVQTRVRRDIARATSLKQAAIRRHMRIIRARRGDLRATLIAEAWAPNLASFAAREVPEGVRAKVWGRNQLHRGAFLGNQQRTAFARTSPRRLPIKALRGPSLRRTFIRRAIRESMVQTASERWAIEFDRALRFQLRRFNR